MRTRELAALAWAFAFLVPSSGIALAPNLYISTAGSDEFDGTTPDRAILSLDRAREVSRQSGRKNICLMGGVYARQGALELKAADTGESWNACPGEHPVLDGNDETGIAIVIRGDRISVAGLIVRRFRHIGILAQYVSDVSLTGNTISNISSDAGNQGGIVALNGFQHGVISNNTIAHIGYGGIVIATSEQDRIDDLTISYNVVRNACERVGDCGAIYVDDRSHSSHGISIDHNSIHDYGLTVDQTKGIYLDDQLSNAIVSNNVVDGEGTYAFQIHGGDHNLILNNIFNITDDLALSLYQYDGEGAENFGMSFNLFRCNIVYSNQRFPRALWDLRVKPTDSEPVVRENVYWFPPRKHLNRESLMDASPTVANPHFVNPRVGDYRLHLRAEPRGCRFDGERWLGLRAGRTE